MCVCVCGGGKSSFPSANALSSLPFIARPQEQLSNTEEPLVSMATVG